jgi:4-azaleucine resistance transporter AzlC
VRRPADFQAREPGWTTYLDGVRAAAPIGVAALAFGVSFGVLARAADMGSVAPVVMSVTTFAGSAQFAVASILGAGGGLVTAIVAAILLNLRYGPIGLSAATTLEGPWWRRALTAQLIVDESWAIAQRDDGRLDRHLLVGAGLLLFVSWTTGTVIGTFAGDLVADPESLGLDAAFPALFLALLWSQARERSRLLAALGGATIALVLMPPPGPGIPIVAPAGLPDRRRKPSSSAVWIQCDRGRPGHHGHRGRRPSCSARRTPPPRAQAALEHLARPSWPP